LFLKLLAKVENRKGVLPSLAEKPGLRPRFSPLALFSTPDLPPRNDLNFQKVFNIKNVRQGKVSINLLQGTYASAFRFEVDS